MMLKVVIVKIAIFLLCSFFFGVFSLVQLEAPIWNYIGKKFNRGSHWQPSNWEELNWLKLNRKNVSSTYPSAKEYPNSSTAEHNGALQTTRATRRPRHNWDLVFCRISGDKIPFGSKLRVFSDVFDVKALADSFKKKINPPTFQTPGIDCAKDRVATDFGGWGSRAALDFLNHKAQEQADMAKELAVKLDDVVDALRDFSLFEATFGTVLRCEKKLFNINNTSYLTIGLDCPVLYKVCSLLCSYPKKVWPAIDDFLEYSATSINGLLAGKAVYEISRNKFRRYDKFGCGDLRFYCEKQCFDFPLGNLICGLEFFSPSFTFRPKIPPRRYSNISPTVDTFVTHVANFCVEPQNSRYYLAAMVDYSSLMEDVFNVLEATVLNSSLDHGRMGIGTYARAEGELGKISYFINLRGNLLGSKKELCFYPATSYPFVNANEVDAANDYLETSVEIRATPPIEIFQINTGVTARIGERLRLGFYYDFYTQAMHHFRGATDLGTKTFLSQNTLGVALTYAVEVNIFSVYNKLVIDYSLPTKYAAPHWVNNSLGITFSAAVNF